MKYLSNISNLLDISPWQPSKEPLKCSDGFIDYHFPLLSLELLEILGIHDGRLEDIIFLQTVEEHNVFDGIGLDLMESRVQEEDGYTVVHQDEEESPF